MTALRTSSTNNDNNLAALASYRAGTKRPTQQAATLDGGNSGGDSVLHKDPLSRA